MAKRKALWVTTDGNSATVGKVRSAHRSHTAAIREHARLLRKGERRLVLPAELMALVQGGMDSTTAVQTLAGKTYEPATVEVFDT